MTNKDDKYILPTPETPATNLTVIDADPTDLYMMIQTVINERPVFADFLDRTTPQDLIHFIGWVAGLMHNQHPILYKAVSEAIIVGKDVAIVLREQIEKQGLKLPENNLTLIWPTGLLLNQFRDSISPKEQ